MQDLGPATDDQVILAWLQAEVESPRFQANLLAGARDPVAFLALARQVAHDPDLNSHQQNAVRRAFIAGARGFGIGTAIFAGLDNDIVWRRVSVTVPEVAEMYYANVDGWTALAPDTRRVGEGASNVGLVLEIETASIHVLSLARVICHSKEPVTPTRTNLPEAARRPPATDGRPYGVFAYVGTTGSVGNWAWL